MNLSRLYHASGRWFSLGLAITGLKLAAFPPAPPQIVFGLVRDQMGNPLTTVTAMVSLTSGSGTVLNDAVVPNLTPGTNYRIEVPMDVGLTPDLYQPSALLPAAPFKISVRLSGATYVPIEMKGDFSVLGEPGGKTRIDLTLGVDGDNDGLPDAWEQAVFSKQGLTWKPGALHPGDHFPGTGLTYYQVYIAGTYTYAPKDGFVLKLEGMVDGKAQLAFTAVKGRNYTIQAAHVVGVWSTVDFRLTTDAPDSGTRPYFQAIATAKMNVEIPSTGQASLRGSID